MRFASIRNASPRLSGRACSRIRTLATLSILYVLGFARAGFAEPPTYVGEVCLNGTDVTVTVTADPVATAMLIYPDPPGGGYFMAADGGGAFSVTFPGFAPGQAFSFHLVIQTPAQYEFPAHTFTLASGCEGFTSDDAGGGGGGGGGPLPNRGFQHDVVESGGAWSIEIETAAPQGPIPPVNAVDVRYRVNGGAFVDTPMTALGDWRWKHNVAGLEAGDVLEYSFLETIGVERVDTAWFTRTVGSEPPPLPDYPLETIAAARFRDRHENEWRFDHYVQGYEIGRTFDVRIVDHGNRLDVELSTTEDVPVNFVDMKWYSQSGPQGFCDRNIAMISVAMSKNGSTFSSSINGVVHGQRVDIEFTLGAGQVYYSEFLHYYVGDPRIQQERQHPFAYAAGDASVSAVSVKQFAFNQHAKNLPPDALREFLVGKIMFETRWDDGLLFNPPTAFDCNGGPVGFNMGASPVFEPGRLGPLYTNNSCIECHMLDGRGRAPVTTTDSLEDYVLRVSVGATAPDGVADRPGRATRRRAGSDASAPGAESLPHPYYGSQIDLKSIGSTPAEAEASMVWETVTGMFDDGTSYELRRPVVRFNELRYGPLGSNIKGASVPSPGVPAYEGEAQLSVRVAPMLIGLGLLEAVAESEILAWADPDDANGDGISGRANRVEDREHGGTSLGRFGWKAAQPSLRQQAAAAFRHDMGMTSSLYPTHDCSPVQSECDQAADDTAPEISDESLDQMATYLRGITVPPRENYTDPQALLGKSLFEGAGCMACHRPTMRTAADAAFAPYRNQVIQPFTDMLLHDMGPGLADGRPEFGATGREWRTAPLWGIGYVGHVLGTPTDPFDPNGNPAQPNYLHDGRARSIMEAILWHGGEAAGSRDAVLAMSAAERDALVAYTSFPFVDSRSIVEAAAVGRPRSADVDRSGVVDVVDLLAVLAGWGPCGDCRADLDVSGSVDFADVLEVLVAWGTPSAQ